MAARAIVVLTAGLTASPGISAVADQLVTVASGGAFEAALTEYFYEPYERETGIDIVHVPARLDEQFARLRAMNEVGQIEWDVVTSTPLMDIAHADLLEPLDCARIPNAAKLAVPGTCGTHSVVRTIGSVGIAYNTDVFGAEGPQDWVDFWDTERFPGTRCLYTGGVNQVVGILVAALRADGVDRADLFPVDLERAFAKLDEIKDDVAQWPASPDLSMTGLRSGECDMGTILSGRVIQMINEGEPLAFVWTDSYFTVGHWAIAKGTENLDAAYAFLDWFLTDAERHLAFSLDMVYDTANLEALDLVPDGQLPLRSSYQPNFDAMVRPDYHWIAANQTRVREAFAEYLTR